MFLPTFAGYQKLVSHTSGYLQRILAQSVGWTGRRLLQGRGSCEKPALDLRSERLFAADVARFTDCR